MLRRIQNFFSHSPAKSIAKPRDSQQCKEASRNSNAMGGSEITRNSTRKPSKTGKSKRTLFGIEMNYNGTRPILLARAKTGRVEKRARKRKKLSREYIDQAMGTVNVRSSAQKHAGEKKMNIEESSEDESKDEEEEAVTICTESKCLNDTSNKNRRSSWPKGPKNGRGTKRARSGKKVLQNSADQALSTANMCKLKDANKHVEEKEDKNQCGAERYRYSGPTLPHNENNKNVKKINERTDTPGRPSFFTRIKENLFGRSRNADSQDSQTTACTTVSSQLNAIKSWPYNPLAHIAAVVRCLPQHYAIAEFGCGGRLAREVPHRVYVIHELRRPKFRVESMHVAVFCLSLMGTCLRECMLEVNRFLKSGGLVIIAEIRSRYDNQNSFLSGMRSCGFELLKKQNAGELFTYFEFQKVRSVEKFETIGIQNFALKPCMYRQRRLNL